MTDQRCLRIRGNGLPTNPGQPVPGDGQPSQQGGRNDNPDQTEADCGPIGPGKLDSSARVDVVESSSERFGTAITLLPATVFQSARKQRPPVPSFPEHYSKIALHWATRPSQGREEQGYCVFVERMRLHAAALSGASSQAIPQGPLAIRKTDDIWRSTNELPLSMTKST